MPSTQWLLLALLAGALCPVLAREQVLATYAHPLTRQWCAVSPDGRRVITLEEADGKQRLLVNGKPEARFDAVLPDTVTFSPDGRRLAYVACTGVQKVVVVDGKVSTPYDDLTKIAVPTLSPDLLGLTDNGDGGEPQVDYLECLTFSPDSRHVAFCGKSGIHWRLVVDGKESAAYEELSTPFFSPDGTRLACVATSDGVQLLLLDGKEGKRYEAVIDPLFSSNGTHVVYRIKQGEQRCLVTEEGVGAPYDAIHSVTFSMDGKHLACVAVRGVQQRVVLDGKEGTVYDDLRALTFSADGARLACIARSGVQQCVMVDGKEEARFPRIALPPVFSPDGKRLAYGVWQDGKTSVVVDGAAGKAYAAVESLTFSADSAHLAYAAHDSGKVMVVLDGQEGAPYDALLAAPGDEGIAHPALLYTGGHVAYAARLGRQWFVVASERRDGPYDGVRRLLHSPDGAHLGYLATVRGELGMRDTPVLDGRAGKPLGAIADDTLRFSPNSAHLACVARTPDGECAILDGVPGACYQSILGARTARLFFDTPAQLRYLTFKADPADPASTPANDTLLPSSAPETGGKLVQVVETVGQ